jgi:hypothetical protein
MSLHDRCVVLAADFPYQIPRNRVATLLLSAGRLYYLIPHQAQMDLEYRMRARRYFH